MGTLYIIYLRLPGRVDPRPKATWEPLVVIFERQLTRWKSNSYHLGEEECKQSNSLYFSYNLPSHFQVTGIHRNRAYANPKRISLERKRRKGIP